MDVCQRQTLRCFENTRDYVNVQAKDNLYGVNLKKFPSKCSCQRRNKSNYIYIYCRFELLLHMYCTVCTCTYSYMHALGISTTDVGSIHQKFFVNILSCWIRSHSFFLMLRFFRKYRFGFHNKSLLRTVYYCTVYARIHLLLKKEKIACQIFFSGLLFTHSILSCLSASFQHSNVIAKHKGEKEAVLFLLQISSCLSKLKNK